MNNSITDKYYKVKENIRKLEKILIYDLESYSNFFLLCLYDTQANNFHTFSYYTTDPSQLEDVSQLKTTLNKYNTQEYLFVGFNNLCYDNPVLQTFLNTKSISKAKEKSNTIIENKKYSRLSLFSLELDLLQIYDRKFSLKEAQARLGLDKIIQEGKDTFSKDINKEDIPRIVEYCKHDCLSTFKIIELNHSTTIKKTEVKIELAKKYSLKDYNYTESGLTETIFKKIIYQANPQYKPAPTLIAFGQELISNKLSENTFKTKEYKDLFKKISNFKFKFELKNDKLISPKFSQSITLKKGKVNIKSGGLHTVGISCARFTSDTHKVINVDVSSYYPTTIINENISPDGLQHIFLPAYKNLLETRLKLKKEGKTVEANSLKILLNGGFGKSKDKHSSLYSPLNMLRVTLNCQLFYLLLVEQLDAVDDIEILQVNTDGICVYLNKEKENEFNKICNDWQAKWNYKLDTNVLDGILLKDANNYAWIENGKITKEKGKGFLTDLTIFRGCDLATCVGKSILAYFKTQTPVRNTIQTLVDQQSTLDFLMFKKRSRVLYRYYHAKTNEKIPGVAVNVLPAYDIKDLDYHKLNIEKYIDQANDIIKKLEPPKLKTLPLFPEPKPSFEYIPEPECVLEPGFKTPEPETPIPELETLIPEIFELEIPKLETLIPESLTKLDTWIVWYKEKRQEKIIKIPFSTKGFPASPTNPNHCASYQTAQDFINNNQHISIKGQEKKLGGLGFVFFEQNEIIGIDLDNCIKDSKLTPEASQIVTAFQSYCEMSPSNRGLHIYVKGRLPENARNRYRNFEIYSKNRYFTVTGKKVPGFGFKEIVENQEAINWFVKNYIGFKETQVEPIEDEFLNLSETELKLKAKEIIREIEISNFKDVFIPLYYNKWTPDNKSSHSEADFKLCCVIARFTTSYKLIEHIFNQSQLSQRDKWQNRKDYRERTIHRAINTITKNKATLKLSEIENAQPLAINNMQNINSFDEININQSAIIISPTGTGKTYHMCKTAITIVEKEMKGVTIFTDTINNVQNISNTLTKKFKFPSEHIAIVISAGTDEAKEKAPLREIAISTYAYLGFKGHSGDTYNQANKLIEDRVVLLDEFDQLYSLRLRFEEPLACRYKHTGNTLKRISKCPLKTRTGNCSNCYISSQRETPNERTNRCEFYHSFDLAYLNEHKDYTKHEIENASNFHKYTQVFDTLFIRKANPSDVEYIKGEFGNFLRTAFENLEFPYFKVVRKYMTTENKEIIPNYACDIPILSGFSNLPLTQLLKSDRTLGYTATITKHTLLEMNKYLNSKVYVNQHVPATFNGTFLRTTQKISHTAIKNICKYCKQNDLEALIVFARKSDAVNFYNSLSDYKNINIMLYLEKNFELRSQRKSIYEYKNICTYARSALLRGIDFPNKTILIIDCSFILPQCAARFDNENKEKAKEEALEYLQEDYNITIQQIIGRILRSNQKPIPNKTIKDEKKLIIILYNLIPGLKFTIKKDLFHNLTDIVDIFTIKSDTGEYILSSIQEILDDKPISNKLDAYSLKLAKKSNENLSKQQRKLAKNIKQEQKEAKRQAKRQEILRLAKELGSSEKISWREFRQKYHISRYFKDFEMDDIKSYFP